MPRAILVLIAVCLFAHSADAKPRHHKTQPITDQRPAICHDERYSVVCSSSMGPWSGRVINEGAGWGQKVAGLGPRPSRWCGWWLANHLGLNDRRLNVARNWASLYGRPASPQAGAVIVWPHHVGIITAYHGNGTATVLSGNDGHAVRERVRSLRGAIAFRVS